MAETTMLRTRPLAHLTERMRAGTVSGERPVSLAERPFLAMVDIRVAAGSAAAARVAAVLGTALVPSCGEVAESAQNDVLWLGPDEWLVVSQADAGEVTRQLIDALHGDHGSVVDVSANRTVLELSGRAARSVLEKGCPVDLHPRSFAEGRAVSTTLARVPVLLWQSGPTTYRLLPRSSFADYVARWLLDAMQEFSGPEVR